MILHQIEALAAAGVTDIVLAVNYRPEIMEKFLADVSSTFEPMGSSANTDWSSTTVCHQIQH